MKKLLVTAGLFGSLLFGQDAMAADYTVKPGDYLWKIANENKTTVSQIMEWNSLSSYNIYPGQVLKVSEEQTNLSTHTVKSGETFYLIAKQYGITTTQLSNINPQIVNPNMLYVGQTIYVPTQSAQAVTGQAIIQAGEKYIGASYLYGASMDRTDVFDCSSFTKRVFQDKGITIPRITRDQATIGKEVPLSEAKLGDLIFYDTNFDGMIDHVGIYVDRYTMLHASTTAGVKYSNTSYYWNDRFVKVVRVLN